MRLPGLRRLSLVWVVPVAALLIGGYLVVTALSQRGPAVKITFDTASGVSVGTKVLHKAVQLGSVTAIALASDMSHVTLTMRMTSDATRYLTGNARFWVVRPELSGGSVTGLTTLLSGSYIEVDPGREGGSATTEFTGLESPPGVRSDEPGTTFVLHAPTVASLNSGTPVFYRDVPVGEVLNHQILEGSGAITGQVFVRAPYDKRVRTGTVWWQASGVAASWEANGLRVELPSALAALSGGVAFNIPPESHDYPVAPDGTTFPLFSDQDAAYRASDRERLVYVVYLTSPVAGLAPGSPVRLYGRQVGEVTGVQLLVTTPMVPARVRAVIDVLPASLTMVGGAAPPGTALAGSLVAGGLQATLEAISYVTGSQAIALTFTGVPTRRVPETENGIVVLPLAGTDVGGGILASTAGFLGKMQSLPFKSLGDGINAALGAASGILGALNPGLQAQALVTTLQSVRSAVGQADASLAPIFRSLPETMDTVQQQLAQANHALAAVDDAFGSGSTLTDTLARKMADYFDTVRYVRLLADYLTRHPEAIARGTTGQGTER